MQSAPAPILAWHELVSAAVLRRAAGQTLCAAIGDFATLSRGDVQFLEFASQQADCLIVLVGCDGSAAAIWHCLCAAGVRWPDLVGIPEDGLEGAVAAIAPEILCHRQPLHPKLSGLLLHHGVRPVRFSLELDHSAGDHLSGGDSAPASAAAGQELSAAEQLLQRRRAA